MVVTSTLEYNTSTSIFCLNLNESESDAENTEKSVNPFPYVLIIICLCIITQNGRVLIDTLMVDKRIYVISREVIAILEMCAVHLIADSFEKLYYYPIIFMVEAYWVYVESVAFADVSVYIEKLILEEKDVSLNLIVVTVQILVGLFICLIRYLKEPGPLKCDTPLPVPVLKGATVEGFLMFTSQLSSVLLYHDYPLFANYFVSAAISTILIAIGLNYTGGMFNPILATSSFYKCFKDHRLAFFTVYWIGPIVGGLLAHVLYSTESFRSFMDYWSDICTPIYRKLKARVRQWLETGIELYNQFSEFYNSE